MTLPYYLPRALMVDAFGPNPLVTDLEARRPKLAKMAKDRGPAPTLFATGNLPPFTASGVDPDLLKGLPYNWRHAAASEPDRTVVLAWLEQCAMDRAAFTAGVDAKAHVGLLDYQARMEGWTHGLLEPDVSIEEATYPDAFKSPAMRRADAAQAQTEKDRVKADELRDELSTVASQWPRDERRMTEIVGELAALDPSTKRSR